ncbi:MAG: hypothetical protein EOP84_07585 [Verrucomicrobiaceae bacterium]|nr:MAG: hypothetical protein EOP84_07585 [Verrucomicrobiaceae bacterium]
MTNWTFNLTEWLFGVTYEDQGGTFIVYLGPFLYDQSGDAQFKGGPFSSYEEFRVWESPTRMIILVVNPFDCVFGIAWGRYEKALHINLGMLQLQFENNLPTPLTRNREPLF